MGNNQTSFRPKEKNAGRKTVESESGFEAEPFIDIFASYELSRGTIEGPVRMQASPIASLLSLKQDIAESRKMNNAEDVLIYIDGKLVSNEDSFSVEQSGIGNNSKLLIRDNSRMYAVTR